MTVKVVVYYCTLFLFDFLFNCDLATSKHAYILPQKLLTFSMLIGNNKCSYSTRKETILKLHKEKDRLWHSVS